MLSDKSNPHETKLYSGRICRKKVVVLRLAHIKNKLMCLVLEVHVSKCLRTHILTVGVDV